MSVVFVQNIPAATERGTLRIAHRYEWGGKESLDPVAERRFLPTILMLYDRLVRPDKDGNPIPALAKSWNSDETGRKFTFKLRKNVRFHNGKPLTAKDVAYTFKHIVDPDFDSPAATALNIVDVEAFEMPDEHTIVFNLKKPHFKFHMLLMYYMVCIIPEGSADTIGKTGIGTGPFKLEKLDLDNTTVLVANDDYWQGKPGLKQIDIVGIADKNDEIYALLDGRIDYVSQVSPVQARLFKEQEKFIVQEAPTGRSHNLVMDTQKPPFNDVRVRKAMKLVVDRQKMIDIVLRGHGVIGYDHPVWPNDPYHLKLDRPQEIERARMLLAEADYKDDLDVELFVADVNAYMVVMAVVYKKMAAKAGIRVKIKYSRSKDYYNDIWKKVPFYGSEWGERIADQILFEAFTCGAPWNETFWCNKKFVQLLNNARNEKDSERRKARYQEAQLLVAEEGGVILPFFQNTIRAFSSDVKGIYPDVSDKNIDWSRITKKTP